MKYGNLVVLAALVGTLVLQAGCGTVRETLPARAAMEQLIISTAADRSIDDMEAEDLRGQRIFLEFGNLESIDQAYVQQAVRDRVLGLEAVLVDEKGDADIVLELASGGLSIDRRNYLLGIPSIAIPTPTGPVKTPELPLFKVTFYRGKAKLLASAVDPANGTQVFDVPHAFGRANESYWWFFLFGPIKFSDLPREIR